MELWQDRPSRTANFAWATSTPTPPAVTCNLTRERFLSGLCWISDPRQQKYIRVSICVASARARAISIKMPTSSFAVRSFFILISKTCLCLVGQFVCKQHSFQFTVQCFFHGQESQEQYQLGIDNGNSDKRKSLVNTEYNCCVTYTVTRIILRISLYSNFVYIHTYCNYITLFHICNIMDITPVIRNLLHTSHIIVIIRNFTLMLHSAVTRSVSAGDSLLNCGRSVNP